MKCFGDSLCLCPFHHLESLNALGDCEVKEECADYAVNHDGWHDAVVIIEETEPNTCACFGCDYEGYCEVQCGQRRDCDRHCDWTKSYENAVIILWET